MPISKILNAADILQYEFFLACIGLVSMSDRNITSSDKLFNIYLQSILANINVITIISFMESNHSPTITNTAL